MTEGLVPLYMWAGGKSRLIQRYKNVWPDDTGLDYVEPFFGGGAIFCWRKGVHRNLKASIGDINEELIGLLTRVRSNPQGFINGAQRLARDFLTHGGKRERKDWFYSQRTLYWEKPTSERLYILMRLGFNGIWQTCAASNGLFGTPAGLLNQTAMTQIVDADLIRQWSQALQGVTLHAGSYDSIPLFGRRSLIYLDPPYRDSYTTYGTGFSDADQKALADWYRDRVADGHVVILANRCVEGDSFFEDLLGDIANFTYFDVKYTAGRRKKVETGYEAKSAREFVAISINESG